MYSITCLAQSRRDYQLALYGPEHPKEAPAPAAGCIRRLHTEAMSSCCYSKTAFAAVGNVADAVVASKVNIELSEYRLSFFGPI